MQTCTNTTFHARTLGFPSCGRPRNQICCAPRINTPPHVSAWADLVPRSVPPCSSSPWANPVVLIPARIMRAPPSSRPAMTLVALAHLTTALAGGTTWDRIGPWNIFDDKDGKGESGTVACAASPAGNPNVIYAGGQNNGVSSGVIKTIDGGKHWTRNSKGLWDTRILGVWVHPDDAQGNHVCHREGLNPGLRADPTQACYSHVWVLPLGRSWRGRTLASTSRWTARRAGASATRARAGATCRASARA